jgi:hypothetical protein
MTRHSHLRDFIDHAFARSTPLCCARFGELAVEVSMDERTAELGFQRALLPTDAVADTSFAILTGDHRAFVPMVPEQSDTIHLFSDHDFYAYWRPGTERQFIVLDRRQRRGAIWYPEAIPAGALGQPCEPLVQAAIETTEWVIAHGAAVGRNGRFLLLLGPGKAGKSTATLACIRAGWQYAGDDLVLLNPSKGLVAPLFSSARVRHSGARAFQTLVDEAFMVSDDEGAPRYELRLAAPPSSGKVAAVVAVHRRGLPGVRYERARPLDFLGSLLRDSTARAVGCASSMTPKLLAAARMAPAYAVDTGTDPAEIPAGLGRLLEAVP